MGRVRGLRVRLGVGALAGLALVLPGIQPPATAAAARSTQPTFATYETGFVGGEPTVGVLKDGSIVAQAYHKVVRSSDRGRTWKLLHEAPEASLDPYIHVDEATGRIFTSQLLGACQSIYISDDNGAAWTPRPTQCGTGDHQKLGSGPWHEDTSHLYPRNVYSCFNHVSDTACATSLDGANTWLPPVVVFPGVDPTATDGVGGIATFCGGLSGDPVSGPDGTIYLPREYCGRPFVAVSTDDGLTWERRQVAAPSQARPIAFGANNPAVSVAADGTVFYAWTGGDYAHYLSRSRDRGVTWSKPWRLSPPGVGSTTFPVVIAGRAGAVATGFIGTVGSAGKNPQDVAKSSRWHLYLATTMNGNATAPTWTTQRVTKDPVMPGCVGRHAATSCSNSALLDFNDIALDRSGRIVMSYGDACPKGCREPKAAPDATVGIVVQTGGPSFS